MNTLHFWVGFAVGYVACFATILIGSLLGDMIAFGRHDESTVQRFKKLIPPRPSDQQSRNWRVVK